MARPPRWSKKLSRVTLVLLCFLSFNLIIPSQNNAQSKSVTQKKPAESGRNADKEKDGTEVTLRRQRAYWMLESAAGKIKESESSLMKVKVLALLADSFWEHDEPRARKLFADALRVLVVVKLDASKDQRALATPMNSSNRLDNLRSDILQKIARRDYELAEQLRETINEPETNDKAQEESNQSEKANLSWEIAVAAAKKHPEHTLRFMRAQFRNGINPLLGDALIGIRLVNPELADQIFNESLIVARANRSPEVLAILAEFVLPTEEEAFHRRQIISDPNRAAAMQRFLTYVADRLTAQVASGDPVVDKADEIQSEYQTLKSLVPFFESLVPNRIATVSNRMSVLLAALSSSEAEALSPSHPCQLKIYCEKRKAPQVEKEMFA